MNLFDTQTRLAFTIFGKPQQRGSKTFASARGGGALLMGKGGEPYIERYGRAWIVRNAYPIITDDNSGPSKKWMKLVAQVARNNYGNQPPIARPVMLTARFYFERPQSHYGTGRNAERLKDSAPEHHGQSPDLAKLLRALEDAMSGIVYVDDRLIARYGEGTGRYWAAPGQWDRCEVVVEELA